jgi:hypothetical protein
MTKWLKDEGDGKPIPEPKHDVEKPEHLSCFADKPRPKTFLFLPSFAAREAQRVLKKAHPRIPDHKEEWEAVATYLRTQLVARVLGAKPEPLKPKVTEGTPDTKDGIATMPVVIYPEADLPIPFLVQHKSRPDPRNPVCLLLHLDGKAEALKQPLAAKVLEKGWSIIAPDLRATGETKPAGDAVAGAPDHHIAEHGLWLGRPLLGQWLQYDIPFLLDWTNDQTTLDKDRVAIVGFGPAGVLALLAAGLYEHRVAAVAAVDALSSYVTDQAYATGTPMGLLAPGILKVGDIPHFAALLAPRKLIIAGGVSPQGKKLTEKELKDAYAYTSAMYKVLGAENRLRIIGEIIADDVASGL